MNRSLLNVALLSATLTGLSAVAADLQSMSVTLPPMHVDMSQPQGQREVANLARRAAMRLCSRFRNETRIDDRENYFACVKSATIRVRTVSVLQPRSDLTSAGP